MNDSIEEPVIPPFTSGERRQFWGDCGAFLDAAAGKSLWQRILISSLPDRLAKARSTASSPRANTVARSAARVSQQVVDAEEAALAT